MVQHINCNPQIPLNVGECNSMCALLKDETIFSWLKIKVKVSSPLKHISTSSKPSVQTKSLYYMTEVTNLFL